MGWRSAGSAGRGAAAVPVDLAGYRIVQASLTNALRHAGQAEATVTLDYRGDTLVVEVTDTGHGAAVMVAAGPRRGTDDADGADGAGRRHGIAGMRERAAALGGELDAGDRPGGGFTVRAMLPVEGS